MSGQNRRQFLKSLAVAAGSFSTLSIGSCQSSFFDDRGAAPNVLLIMTDDQGWGDIRSHSNEKIDTPVADALAGQGARFDRFYVCSLCAPTRASLLTGRYYPRTGVHGVTRGAETMRAEEVTLAEALHQAGYATGCFGKWHNGAHYPHNPNGQGFDEFLGFCGGHWNNYFDTTLERNGQAFKSQGYITDVITDAAIDFIKSRKQQPFFCYVPYNAPHSPFQVPDKYFDKYKARGLDDTLACVYGMCENVDDNVGRLLSCLDEYGLSDNTIVLFLTDNGPNTDRYNGGMKGRKGSMDEGGVRVPLFVRWPGRIEPGLRIEPLAAHIDVFPTIMELCGVSMPKTLPQDGKSLAPLLQSKSVDSVDWPDRRLHSFRWPDAKGRIHQGAVRTQQWRAVLRRNGWMLYDMVHDPGQKSNVAKAHPEVLASLQAAFEAKCRDVTSAGFDPIPTHVGHRDWPVVTLPGHEANLVPKAGQGISYVGRAGWANDWITNWTDTQAYAWWPVKIVASGRFEVTLMYTCPPENLGAKLRVEIGDRAVEGTVKIAHDPEPIPSPDRVERKEVYEKVWAPLTLGTLDLDPAQGRLILRVVDIPGHRAPDIKAVKLRRVS